MLCQHVEWSHGFLWHRHGRSTRVYSFSFPVPAGVGFRYARRDPGQQVGIPWTDQTRLTDLDFADDIALLANSIPALQALTTSLEDTASKVGLRISIDKLKTMQAGAGRQGARSGLEGSCFWKYPSSLILAALCLLTITLT